MIYNILANISFTSLSERKLSIKNGYKPAFKLENRKSFNSGIINLKDRDELFPGESSDAIISFFSDEPFFNLSINSKFEFYEGRYIIGYGVIIEFIGWRKPGDLSDF